MMWMRPWSICSGFAAIQTLSRQIQKACESTLYGRSEFQLTQEAVDEPVEQARRFLVRHRMSWGGLGEQWSYSVADLCGGMASVERCWRSVVERLTRCNSGSARSK